MRPFPIALVPALVLGTLLPAAALAQTQTQSQAECEYRNPDNPNWNYRRACTVRAVESGDRVTTTADVANGSTLTIVEETTGGAVRFAINGYAATRLEGGASRCYLTIDDEETICIHGLGTGTAEAGADAAQGTPETDVPAPDTPVDTAASGVPLGGGEAGHCLSWVADGDREGLIEQGACTRRTDCTEVEGEGGMSCLIDLVWASGRETVITRKGGVYTLDGAVAEPDATGCLTDTGGGLHFCFSQAEMTAATYPALALPPAPEPAPLVAAAAPAETAPEAETASGSTGNRCSFLRDDTEVSSWSCTETVTCDDPICTVSYVFENGTNVTLDTADGMVMLMNGAKADPAAWAEGAVVDVTRPGAPYTFRFTPATAASAAQ
ncbi:MAG: hypothetical protein KDK53_01530 [Maritimibacter sp.]|nr:hypothetical protein [Maritimibacter sp.]